jgi:hypothetical protein
MSSDDSSTNLSSSDSDSSLNEFTESRNENKDKNQDSENQDSENEDSENEDLEIGDLEIGENQDENQISGVEHEELENSVNQGEVSENSGTGENKDGSSQFFFKDVDGLNMIPTEETGIATNNSNISTNDSDNDENDNNENNNNKNENNKVNNNKNDDNENDEFATHNLVQKTVNQPLFSKKNFKKWIKKHGVKVLLGGAAVAGVMYIIYRYHEKIRKKLGEIYKLLPFTTQAKPPVDTEDTKLEKSTTEFETEFEKFTREIKKKNVPLEKVIEGLNALEGEKYKEIRDNLLIHKYLIDNDDEIKTAVGELWKREKKEEKNVLAVIANVYYGPISKETGYIYELNKVKKTDPLEKAKEQISKIINESDKQTQKAYNVQKFKIEEKSAAVPWEDLKTIHKAKLLQYIPVPSAQTNTAQKDANSMSKVMNGLKEYIKGYDSWNHFRFQVNSQSVNPTQ